MSKAHVYLLQTVPLLPKQSTFVRVHVEGEYPADSTLLMEQDTAGSKTTVFQVEDLLVQLAAHSTGQILVTNPTGFTQTLSNGAGVGNVSPVVVKGYTETMDGSKMWRVMVGGQEEDPD